jgi:hypothetical protein
MNYHHSPHTRATLLARALLARIGELPVNEVRRDEARCHWEHAETASERWFQAFARMRAALARRPVAARRQRA